MKDIRVRFAPSPTGHLHVGGARTALYNALYARKNKGTFILRAEDTDEARSKDEYLISQIKDLMWLGLEPQEGFLLEGEKLISKGSLGPYRQTERLDIYKKWALQLVEEKKAYHCFLTDEEIKEQKEKSKKEKKPPVVRSPYRDLDLKEAEKKLKEGKKASLRFKVPKEVKKYEFEDLVRGKVSFPSDMVGDFVILRSGGLPVYNFCCAVDDHLMKISHVLRAEEHLNNTVRQLMIYEAFGWEIPQFVHISIILGDDRQKLSKRHGSHSVSDCQKKGILPEALKNYLVLLGWTHPEGKEILTEDEMKEAFHLEKLHKASAIFDEEKLLWMNSEYIRKKEGATKKKVQEIFEPSLKKLSLKEEEFKKFQERMWVYVKNKGFRTFKDLEENLKELRDLMREDFKEEGFFKDDLSKEVLDWPESELAVTSFLELLEKEERDFLFEEDAKELIKSIGDKTGLKGKKLFMPLRVCVMGVAQGVEIKELFPLIPIFFLQKRARFFLSLKGVKK